MSSTETSPPAGPSTARARQFMWSTYREVWVRPALTVAAIGVTAWQLWTKPLVLPPLAITLFALVSLLGLSVMFPHPRWSQPQQVRLIAAFAVLSALLFPLSQSTSVADLFPFVACATAGFTIASRQTAFTIAGTCAFIAAVGSELVGELVPTAIEWQWWIALAVGMPVFMGTASRDRADALRNAHEATEQAKRAASSEAREAALVERGRIAREIHDVLGHSLSGIAVQLDMADALAAKGRQDEAMSAIRKARSLAVDSIGETRRAVHALREDTLPLQETLLLMAAGDGVSFRLVGEPSPVPAEVSHTVVRAAQEALTNAVKYAPGADRSMTVTFTDAAIRLVVANGPAREAIRPEIAGGTGMGLVGMRERVALLGGTLRAGPDQDGGWTVELEVPA